MTHHCARNGLAILILASALTSTARAQGIMAGQTVLPGEAIQDITLLPGTPFNMTGSPILIPNVTGFGEITLNRDAQVGTTIAIPTLAGGQFYGSNPLLGHYVFGNIAPLTGADFSGTITNVALNSSDPGYASGQPSSFQSGDFSFGGNSFGFEFLNPPGPGPTLFTDPSVPFSFTSTFDGLPPSPGTVLMNSGTDVLYVQLDGVSVATSSNRRIIILSSVPEPSGLMLLGAGALGVGVYLRTRSRRKAR